jgi:hypothetical protein
MNARRSSSEVERRAQGAGCTGLSIGRFTHITLKLLEETSVVLNRGDPASPSACILPG